MRTINLPITSRLSATPLIQSPTDNVYYFGVWGVIDFPVSPEDEFYRLTARDVVRWDILANTKYRDYNKMWIFWAANNIMDPFNVMPGTLIRIPGNKTVNSVLQSINGNAP
jgi:hypothetical protein